MATTAIMTCLQIGQQQQQQQQKTQQQQHHQILLQNQGPRGIIRRRCGFEDEEKQQEQQQQQRSKKVRFSFEDCCPTTRPEGMINLDAGAGSSSSGSSSSSSASASKQVCSGPPTKKMSMVESILVNSPKHDVKKHLKKNGGEIKSNLTCPICLDIFYRPCTLLCGHSFCRSCITKYEHTRSSDVTKDCLLPCPTCREPAVGLDKLQESVSLKQLVQAYFPDHVRKNEKLSAQESQRILAAFLNSRQKLIKIREDRERLRSEIMSIHALLEKKRLEHDQNVQDCERELRTAKTLRNLLDQSAVNIKDQTKL